MTANQYAAMIANGQVVNHYQPIVDLRSGGVVGIEVLARLTDEARIIPPAMFLPTLDLPALEDLLFDSLLKGLTTLAACAATHPMLEIAFNIAPGVVLRDGFRETLLAVLSLKGMDPGRITLEVLEADEFLDLDVARTELTRLRDIGLRLALDDVGSGYSSLARIRELPVDTLKLDQGFIRTFPQHPENLQFVIAMKSLARGLRAKLVIEGVETPEILDALGVAGIGLAQGYAIARPMPEAALLDWLRAHVPRPAERQPQTLLGAYAAHLDIVEACRAMSDQSLRVQWAEDVRNPHACLIGRFFDVHGLHDTDFGLAHKRFHALIDRYGDDPDAWEAAVDDLWQSLQAAIKRDAEPLNVTKTSTVLTRIPEMSIGLDLLKHSTCCGVI